MYCRPAVGRGSTDVRPLRHPLTATRGAASVPSPSTADCRAKIAAPHFNLSAPNWIRCVSDKKIQRCTFCFVCIPFTFISVVVPAEPSETGLAATQNIKQTSSCSDIRHNYAIIATLAAQLHTISDGGDEQRLAGGDRRPRGERSHGITNTTSANPDRAPRLPGRQSTTFVRPNPISPPANFFKVIKPCLVIYGVCESALVCPPRPFDWGVR